MKDERPGLLPALGVFTTMMVVIGGVIGSGVFRKSGVMAAQLGSPTLLMGVWVLAGVITLFGTLATAEISGMIPVTGGQELWIAGTYYFAPGENGIYYAGDAPNSLRSTFPLYFLESKTQQTKTIGVLPGPIGWSLALSPGERWITYSRIDRQGSELMLVEKFH